MAAGLEWGMMRGCVATLLAGRDMMHWSTSETNQVSVGRRLIAKLPLLYELVCLLLAEVPRPQKD